MYLLERKGLPTTYKGIVKHVSEMPRVQGFVTEGRLMRPLVDRFVAGEDREDALDVAERLQSEGINVSIDNLGESVTEPENTRAVRDEYYALLEGMASRGLEPNVSVKLTQLGLNCDPDLCRSNLSAIVDYAAVHGGFVRIDMEESRYTDPTLALFYDLYRTRPNLGVVMQSSLRRTGEDVDRLIAEEARVRLCKGAYVEKPDVAFPDKNDVDVNYARQMERLLVEGNYPGIATHDERLIDHAKAYAKRHGIDNKQFEFQMLFGVRRDLQRSLSREGYNVRVYVPYGPEWYAYFWRRIGETQRNLAFIVHAVIQETLSSQRAM